MYHVQRSNKINVKDDNSEEQLISMIQGTIFKFKCDHWRVKIPYVREFKFKCDHMKNKLY